ncbi:hypothetical protein V1522DRAFT_392251 [Lipomyces starkeyi]
MAIPSTQASNACIYTTYGVFLVFGLLVAWKFSNRKEFLAAIRSQPAIPLAFNFIASVLQHRITTLVDYSFWHSVSLSPCPRLLNDVNSMFSRRMYFRSLGMNMDM